MTPLDGLAITEGGDGDVGVLWLHGYTMDSTVWERLWRVLPGWRHIGVDLPGHGRSRDARRDEDLTSLAATLSAVARAADVRHVVGLSFGGMVALQVAVEGPPAALSSLTLCSPGIGGGPTEPSAMSRNRQLRRLYAKHGASPQLTELWLRSPPDIFSGARSRPDVWPALASVVARHRWTELGDGSLDTLAGDRTQVARLGLIDLPTLVIVGEHDMRSFHEGADLLVARIPDCTRVEAPGAGHLALLEAPAGVAPLVEAHLRRYAGVPR